MTWSRTSGGSSQTAQEIATAIDADTVAEATLRSALGLVEVVTASPSADQNNYAPSTISTSKAVYTILELTPLATMRITGLSTTSMETGKRILVRNAGSPSASTCRLVVLERNSSSSSAANRLRWPQILMPGFLMPGEFAEFYFNGTDLQLLGSTRLRGVDIFDLRLGTDQQPALANLNSSSTSFGEMTLTHRIPTIRLRTGTNSQGTPIVGYSFQRWARPSANGAMLVHCIAEVEDLADATNDYRFFFGLTSHELDGFTYALAANPEDIVGWRYDRGTSTSWQQVTRASGSTTGTDIAAVVADTPIRFAAFVNGDGTQVDFLHSTDGIAWTVSSTSHTTNIPTTTADAMDLSALLPKTAGTTEREAAISQLGLIGYTR